MTNETFRYRKRRKPESVEKTKRRVSTKITGHEFRAVSLGWDIALPIFAGPLFGVWLDHKLGYEGDRKSTRLNSVTSQSRMPSSA